MRLRTIVGLLMAVVAVTIALSALPAGAQDDGGKKKVLRLGQAQDVQTLNPFVAQDEENFRAWSLNWDLLVNFSPDDLTPVPGIAESWDVSPDKKTVTFKLIEGAKWSDGEPITSKDVQYSLDKLGTDSLIFSGYTSNVTSIETPIALLQAATGHRRSSRRRVAMRRASGPILNTIGTISSTLVASIHGSSWHHEASASSSAHPK